VVDLTGVGSYLLHAKSGRGYPFTATIDADLGIRLAPFGYKAPPTFTHVFASGCRSADAQGLDAPVN
jgi:hypothetical protein